MASQSRADMITHAMATSPSPYIAYVGTYTNPNEADPHGVPHDSSVVGEGIYAFAVSLEGELRPIGEPCAAGINPSFVVPHPSGNFVHVCNETAEWEKVAAQGGLLPGSRYYDAAKNEWVETKAREVKQDCGSIRAFQVDLTKSQKGELCLTEVGAPVASMGGHPCMVSTDKTGSVLACANYSGGNFSLYRVEPTGALGPLISLKVHQGCGRDRIRQEGPHVHSVVFSPTNDHALVCDLGCDRVVSYRFDGPSNALLSDDYSKDKVYDPTVGSSLLDRESQHRSTAGNGPRHLAFHPSGNFAYVVNELAATVDHFGYDGESGTLSPVGSIGMLPDTYEEEEWTSNFGRWAADVTVHPSGLFLFASNRLHDSIVVYQLDTAGVPSNPAWYPSGGRTPRSFSLSHDGNVLVVAHQHSHNIVSFIIDPATGEPIPTGQVMDVPYAACVSLIRNVNNVMIPDRDAE